MAYRDKILRICLDAMMLGAALMLSYLEAVLPLTVWLPLPGFKLGLANIVVTLVFVSIAPVDAAIVSACRISVMGILFGNAASFLFSLGGAVLSYAGLWLLAYIGRRKFSMIGVSVGCAALHNMGQILVASAFFGAEVILGYMPILLVAALLFGLVTGIMLSLILPRFEKIKIRTSYEKDKY